jgi:hypothetical protein
VHSGVVTKKKLRTILGERLPCSRYFYKGPTHQLVPRAVAHVVIVDCYCHWYVLAYVFLSIIWKPSMMFLAPINFKHTTTALLETNNLKNF